jgi:exopolysaccharide production protein ExoQ
MSTILAFLICIIGIATLAYLNRDSSLRNSRALWLPVIWLYIAGSRAVSEWLGVARGGNSGRLASTLDGSPLDAGIYGALMVLGIIVLYFRRDRTIAVLKSSGPVLIYFAYCLISIAWSPIQGPAFKRWIKDIGDLTMVLLIVTDLHPLTALRRLYFRVGIILLPFSVFLIRYTDMGRAFEPMGAPMNTGVTTNKNTLGLVVFLISIGVLWHVRALLRDKKAPNRTRRLVAQIALLCFGVMLLEMAHCATAVACFVIGGGLMLATGMRTIRTQPRRVNALCLGIIFAASLLVLSGGASLVTSALGRHSDLTGRTEIWTGVIASSGNPLIGSGFESFWNTRSNIVAQNLPEIYDVDNLNSAHNGYLEVWLNLGWIGVCLIASIIIFGYRRACKAFQRDQEIGGLLLAYIATGTFYSITEAGFRVLTPSWIFLLLAVVSASGITAGIIKGKGRKVRVPSVAQRAELLEAETNAAYAARYGGSELETSRANKFC